VRMDDLVIGENLTAAQAHLIIGEVLDRITLPRPAKKHPGQSWTPHCSERLRSLPLIQPFKGEERSVRARRFSAVITEP
jgi:hypothetical protein